MRQRLYRWRTRRLRTRYIRTLTARGHPDNDRTRAIAHLAAAMRLPLDLIDSPTAQGLHHWNAWSYHATPPDNHPR